MSKQNDRHTSNEMDADTLSLFGDSLATQGLPDGRKNALFSRIMGRIDENEKAQEPDLITVHADEGEWVTIAPKIEKKRLFLDSARNIESYLLRIQPGAEAPGHTHEEDEYCLVLEGDVEFDEIQLNAGDFHLARRGSRHGTAHSRNGALLYLESAA